MNKDYTQWECMNCGCIEVHPVNADMWGQAGVTKCCASPDWLARKHVFGPEGCLAVLDEK